MAPNRKQLAVALDPLVDTQPLVQAKYLPLTAETTAAVAPVAPAEPTVIRSSNVDHDYWTWEAPAAPADLFSTDRLLEQEAERVCSSEPSKTVASHDDYWAERVEAHQSAVNAAVSDSTGYWDWPEQASDAQIALILQEEFNRQATSGERMEERLQQDSANYSYSAPQDKAEHDDYWAWEPATIVCAKANEVSESYWEWDGAVESEQTQHERAIAALLAYEKARQLLSGEHVQALLEKQAQAPVEPAALKESSCSYWNWPAEEDDYWNMRPVPLAIRAECPKGYWDW